MAPAGPSDAQVVPPAATDPARGQQPQMSDTVATVTASGATNHHVIHHHAPAPPPRTGAMAPHHPLHPQHVQAAVHHQHHPQMAGPVQPAPPLVGGPPPIMGPPLMHPMIGAGPPMASQMAHPPQMMPAPYSNFQPSFYGGNHGGNGNNGAPYEDSEELQLEEEPAWDFCGENYINVDRFFLVAMPCLFLVFNIVYWFAYGSNFILSASDDEV